jgi:NitT/TauT family transport system substrate-binding protein
MTDARSPATNREGYTLKQRKRWLFIAAILSVGALLAAGCGDDDDDGGTSSATTTTAAGGGDETTTTAGSNSTTSLVATAEGCENGVTDPTNMEVGRKVARCEPGYPAPDPLPEMTTINVSSAFKLEFMSPLLLADAYGELEKENLKMNFLNVKFSDAVPQMANGQIDVAVGGIEVALFNAGHNDLPVKAVLANYYPPDAGDYSKAQTGLWCRRDSFTTPDKPNLKEIEDMTLASSVGAGSVSFYYVTAEIKRQGVSDFDLSGANIQAIPSADTVTALENGGIDCGIILDPLWLQLQDKPEYFLAASQTPGEPLGIYAFGKRLLVDHPEIGDAFTRAFLRTINTYYAGDYHSDPEVMQKIAEVTQGDVERLTQVPSLVMDWEFRDGTTTRVQEYLISVKVITDYTEPVPEDKVVDRSFYLRAVGAL